MAQSWDQVLGLGFRGLGRMTRPGYRAGAARARCNAGVVRLRLAVPALVLAGGLSGCGSISDKFRTAASQMPAIGLPAGAPERTAEPVPYPAVHDMPAAAQQHPAQPTEQEQMERELATARDGQQASAGIETQAKKKAKAAAAKPRPSRPPPQRRRSTKGHDLLSFAGAVLQHPASNPA